MRADSFLGSQVTSLEDFIFVSVMLPGEVFELSGPGIESEHSSAFLLTHADKTVIQKLFDQSANAVS
jgi:hypothetical protein